MHDSLNQLPSLKNCILLASTLLWSQASAVCTNWTSENTSSDDGSSFSTRYSIRVDQLACPRDSKQDCQTESKGSYDITASRGLAKSGDVTLQLSDEESDAIFNLARDAYNSAFIHVGTNATNATFETIQTTVSFDGQGSTYSSYRTVEPGTNKTLYWTAFYQYSVGTLSGCTNDTLNNMTVTAAAPYYDEDDDNRTVIAGRWLASWRNTTESVATSTYHGSSMNTYSTALLSVLVGITLLL